MRTLKFIIKTDDDVKLTSYNVKLVQVASKFLSDVFLKIDKSCVDLKSILGVMSVCVSNGKEAEIVITGSDEDNAYAELKKAVL